MFLKPLFMINSFAIGIVVGVLTQTEIDGLPNLKFMIPTDRAPAWRIPDQDVVHTTAYCHLENEPGAEGNLNCLGTPLRYDDKKRSAAADWSRYPVGTQFRIAGEPHLYEIDDYGSGLVGTDTIDLYKPSLEMMDQWGVRQVTIDIVRKGSFVRSAEIMASRTHYPHVAEMYRCVLPLLSGESLAQLSKSRTAKPGIR
jgi:3D (Asp-Asp-Asp) domain-containing protein